MEKVFMILQTADLYITNAYVDIDIDFYFESIAYINMELYVNSTMLYEYQTEFADALADPSSDLWPSHDEVMDTQVDKISDLTDQQKARLVSNNTLHAAQKAHSNIKDIEQTIRTLQDKRLQYRAFVLEKWGWKK